MHAQILPDAEGITNWKPFLGIRTGIVSSASADLLYSPLVYSGKSIGVGLSFGKEKSRSTSETSIYFHLTTKKSATLENQIRSFERGHYLLEKQSFNLKIRDYRRFEISGTESLGLKLYFSGLWFTSINITTNAMGLPELVQTGLAPGFCAIKSAGRHQISIDAHVSLLSLSIRNNYSMSAPQTYERFSKLNFIRQNIRLQSAFSDRQIFARLSYQYPIGRVLHATAAYEFGYLHNTQPKNLRSVEGFYSLAILYKK
jgi:hypothetical protein